MKTGKANFLRAVRETINSFDYDFSSPGEFVKDIIDLAYPKKKSPRAAKILSELGEEE